MNLSTRHKKAIVRASLLIATTNNKTIKEVLEESLLNIQNTIGNGVLMTGSSANGNSVSFATSIDTSPEELFEAVNQILEMVEKIIDLGEENQSQELI